MSVPPPPPPKRPVPPPPIRVAPNGTATIGAQFRMQPKPPIIRQFPNSNWFNLSPKISLDPAVVTGKSIGILGTNGSGKSGTSRQLMEQHIKAGLSTYPFTVCDIENEYATLKELGEIFIAGVVSENSDSIKLDIELSDSAEFYELGRKAFDQKLTIVLLLGDIEEDARKVFLNAYLNGIFESANDPRKAHYYRVFIEEAQEYVAQGGGALAAQDGLRKTIIRFAKRGRKRKLSLAIISQRPSNVDKNVLTQCHLFLLHFVTYDTDVKVYQNQLSVEKAEEVVKGMSPGDCILVFGKTYIQDRITRPKTSSPWDETVHFDPSKFITVEGGKTLQEEIHNDAASSDEGTSVVPTAYIHGLERKLKEAQQSVNSLTQTQVSLEMRIATLETRTVVNTGNIDIDALAAENASLRLRVDKYEAESLPIRILKDIIVKELQ